MDASTDSALFNNKLGLLKDIYASRSIEAVMKLIIPLTNSFAQLDPSNVASIVQILTNSSSAFSFASDISDAKKDDTALQLFCDYQSILNGITNGTSQQPSSLKSNYRKTSIQLLTERTSMFLAQLSANLKIDGASLQCAAGESHSSAMTRLVAGSANTFTSTDSSKISTSEPQLVVSGLDNSSGIYVVDWSVSTANPVDAAVLGSKVSTYSLLFANGSAIGDGTGVSVILAIPFKYALADYGLPTNATGLRYTGVCRHVTGASWSTASVSTAGREQH
eukprot:5780_1